MWKKIKRLLVSKETRNKQYIARLDYVLERIEKPACLCMSDDDLRCLKDSVESIRLYYIGTRRGNSPEELLDRIMKLPAKEMTYELMFYSKVFYFWVKYKRIQGF